MLSFKTHGKWILAGEHAVLRGCTALVFPVSSRFLEFQYKATDKPLSVKMESGNSDLEMAFWGVLEKALQQVSLGRSDLTGELFLKSNIPVGAGMGASATLCVSLARWFTKLNYIKESQQYDFAKSLEDLFHGQSSGVDVAVALHHKALEFRKPNIMTAFTPVWSPQIYLSYCGKRGVTSDCIAKVQSLLKTDPELGKEIDQDMKKAVEMAKTSLLEENNIDLLKSSIHLANSCFDRWGLLNQDLQNHMDFLKKYGAIATKPTGSGDGGFVISLWENPPECSEEPWPFELIKA